MTIKELSVSKEGKQILAPVNLEIEGSFFLGVVGANGIGKSTFLKCLLGKESYQGQIASSFDKNDIGYLAQLQDLNFDLVVRDIVVMGLYKETGMFRSYTSHHFDRVEGILEDLSISNLLNQMYSTLSGGEKQLVWLAQTLISEPRLLILDEPTSDLDIYNKLNLIKLLQQLHVDKGLSVVLVTHDLYLLKEIEGDLLHIGKEQSIRSKISPETINEFYQI